jgi:cytochrome P450
MPEVRVDANDNNRMGEEEIVSQMRTTISAGYETVSAVIAVRCSKESLASS